MPDPTPEEIAREFKAFLQRIEARYEPLPVGQNVDGRPIFAGRAVAEALRKEKPGAD